MNADTINVTTNATTNAIVVETTLNWKPIGRGRKFDRARRALARRLRLPFVRDTLWERDHPESRVGWKTVTYGTPWTSTNALTNFSFACTCHKRERYSRKGRKWRKR